MAGAATMKWQAMARVFPHGEDPSAELARADWKPVFLDAHENETLIALSDTIIPATDTPGAKEALVNRFLDLLMSTEDAMVKQEFLAALVYVDLETTTRYKTAFVNLTADEKNDFLGGLAFPRPGAGPEVAGTHSGYQYFSVLKDWVASAFYRSPIGLKELGWDGGPPSGKFTGCEHAPDAHSDIK
jgi:hypothetical protein